MQDGNTGKLRELRDAWMKQTINTMVRINLTDKLIMQQNLRGVTELGPQIFGGMAFQGEGKVRVNASRQKCTWHLECPHGWVEEAGQEVIGKEVKEVRRGGGRVFWPL